MRKDLLSKSYRAKYPDMPTLKLARIMYAENNLLFTSLEGARTSLRYIEGKSGVLNRKKINKDSIFLKTDDRPKNPYNLPESDE